VPKARGKRGESRKKSLVEKFSETGAAMSREREWVPRNQRKKRERKSQVVGQGRPIVKLPSRISKDPWRRER